MGRPLYTNNAATYLAFGITNTATTMQVSANAGSLFPNPTGGDYFYVSLISLSGPIIEIVKCTACSGDVFTIERGQEGTTPLYWNMGDNVQLRITAAGMNYIAGSTASTTLEQSFTATQGQTVFTLTNFDYSPGNNNLAVFVNGSKQVSGTNYTETNVNTVTFTTGLNAGDIVEFLSNLSVAAGTIYATDINYNEGSTGAVTCTLESKLQESVSVKDFGAVGDGVANDTVAIQSAVTACAGKALYFPAGTYLVSSAITLVSNIHIYGAGQEVSKILVEGSSDINIFVGVNVTQISMSDLWLYGNSVSSGSGSGFAFYIYQNTSATSSGQDYRVNRCRFDNFKGDYWVRILNENVTYPLNNIFITENLFNSYTGNARDGSNSGVPSTCISIYGSTAGAFTTNVIIENNIANCYYIKSFCLLWQGVQWANVSNNIINQCGVSSQITDNCGAYAIMAYDSSSLNVPKNITINNNLINGVRSCGFYGAAAENLTITNNRILNQTDTVSSSLPKGAIVLNGCSYSLISDNYIDTCVFGIAWVTDNQSAHEAGLLIDSNKIYNSGVNAIVLNVAYQATSDISITNNLITGGCASSYMIYLNTASTGTIYRLNILNNSIYSSASSVVGINLGSTDSSYTMRFCTVSGNVIQTSNTGVRVENTLYPIVVSNNTFYSAFIFAGIDATAAADVAILNNVFVNQQSGGYCLRTTSGCKGSLYGNVFQDCATANIYVTSGNTLGITAPWWTPTGYGQPVQNLAIVEAGTAGSKYLITGWFYNGTAWYQERTLTGN